MQAVIVSGATTVNNTAVTIYTVPAGQRLEIYYAFIAVLAQVPAGDFVTLVVNAAQPLRITNVTPQALQFQGSPYPLECPQNVAVSLNGSVAANAKTVYYYLKGFVG